MGQENKTAAAGVICTAAGAFEALHRQADPARAESSARYFKTGPDGYGAGDRFIGLTAPQLHGLARSYHTMPFDEIDKLLQCEIHEVRSLALTIMGARYKKGDAAERAAIFQLYLDRLDRVDNWDLVDGSAPYITGPHLQGCDRSLLQTLADSPVLWRRRVAILSTLHFIRAGELQPTLDLCDRLIADRHDLMHKACGWMLREVGKRDVALLEGWLDDRGPRLPRTMLRYAIERMTPERRRYYMNRK
ncbi:MAG: alkylation repair enzyme [Rhodospirillales bacterium]|nr:alkylation repair enzyme [Rhodospirillales bacterium]